MITTRPKEVNTANQLGLPNAIRGGTLEGVVILELSSTLAGEFAGGLLADMGATVIKIEPPEGSPLRRLGPSINGEDSLYFQSENRGKYSICADLAALRHAPWWLPLLSIADALVEDMGPQQLESIGLSPETLQQHNPSLCLLRLSAFGQTGPLAQESGDDRIAQAFSNMQFMTGFTDRPPIPITVPLADCWSGIHGVNGLLIAMFYARRSYRGQIVDLALYETGLRLQEALIVKFNQTGVLPERFGTQHPGVVPANIYRTQDQKWIALSGAGDQPFVRLCEAIEAPEAPRDPRFATTTSRLKHREVVDLLVRTWIAKHDLADIEARFSTVGVAGTAIRSVDDIIGDEHVASRQSIMQLRSQSGKDFLTPAPAPHFSRTPAQRPARAPRLGEHTDIILASCSNLTVVPQSARQDADQNSSAGPLNGIRVLDLSQWLAGPAATAILADFGADVIMVELPVAQPPPQRPSSLNDMSFLVTNRNKRSLTLDIRTPKGREVLLDLIRVSDVVVENFRPGTLERWELSPGTLLDINPQLVILRASGFGQSGPYRRRSAFNPVGLAFGGMTYLNGWPDRSPLRDGVMAGDYSTVLFNVLGVLAALLRREKDKQGQVVDVAMFETILRMTGDTLAVRSALGIRRERAGGEWPIYPSSITAEANDGHFVAVSSPSWQDIATTLERLGMPRPQNVQQARDAIMHFIGARPALESVIALRQVGLPSSQVNSVAELVQEPHLWSRGNLVRLQDPHIGEVVTQGVMPLLSLTPGQVTGWSQYPGADNEVVLSEILGYSAERIRQVTEPDQ